jgi:hypothetical protein
MVACAAKSATISISFSVKGCTRVLETVIAPITVALLISIGTISIVRIRPNLRRSATAGILR